MRGLFRVFLNGFAQLHRFIIRKKNAEVEADTLILPGNRDYNEKRGSEVLKNRRTDAKGRYTASRHATNRQSVQLGWTIAVGTVLLALAVIRVTNGRIPHTLLTRVPAKQVNPEFDESQSMKLMKPHDVVTQERARRL